MLISAQQESSGTTFGIRGSIHVCFFILINNLLNGILDYLLCFTAANFGRLGNVLGACEAQNATVIVEGFHFRLTLRGKAGNIEWNRNSFLLQLLFVGQLNAAGIAVNRTTAFGAFVPRAGVIATTNERNWSICHEAQAKACRGTGERYEVLTPNVKSET